MKKVSANLTITTRDFLERLGVGYTLKDRLSHKGMRRLLEEKHIAIPKSLRIDDIAFEDLATGKYLLVRSETQKKKKAQIMAYKNPLYESLNSILQTKDTAQELEEKRKEILSQQGLEYDCWGRVEEKIVDPTEVYETYTVTTKTQRTVQYQKSFHKGKKH